MRLIAALALLFVTTVPSPLAAQDRSLHWPSVSVTARLDSTGVLHVQERQVMRFTGVWNGGERVFTVRRGQRLDFAGMARFDPATGVTRAMVQGDLNDVDHYDWANSRAIRWRSRLSSAPAFDDSELTYILTYSYSNILVPQDDGTYLLDHDFGFPDRNGPIEEFTVSLTLDPAWQTSSPMPLRYRETNLDPGVSFTVTVPLTYEGGGQPASVVRGADSRFRLALALALLIVLFTLLLQLRQRERHLGRFVPLIPESAITKAWLQEHVFDHLPEVAGAAWDDQTAAPEVAATLARLVQEKKLSSEVTTVKQLIGSRSVLHLTINVDRRELQEHERALINALFRSKETVTDTDRVRERYRKTGFDPARLIRSRLTTMVERTTPGAKGKTPSRRPTILLLVTALAVLIAGVVLRIGDLDVSLMALGVSAPLYLVTVLFAYILQKLVHNFAVITLFMLSGIGVLTYSLCGVLLMQGYMRAGPVALTGIALWYVALINSILNMARSRQSAERIVVRKQLTAARNYFRRQLAAREPQLDDAWFPYLIAFGLGKHIDKWFRAFGGTDDNANAMIGTSQAMGNASAGHSSGSTWTGFGGGGGFAGAGGGASFASAIGGMAASVPSPSSSGSSSGGSSSGGGSSGGGGGGGW